MSAIIIINGVPESGKTTFTKFCREILEKQDKKNHVLTASNVANIKILAKRIGWDGNKDLKGRKFLSDLKIALDSYNDYTKASCKNLCSYLGENDYVFIDMREIEDIDFAVKEYGAHSVFVRNKRIKKQKYGNIADDNVSKYKYKTYINNNGSLKDLYNLAADFVKEIQNTKRYMKKE